MQTKTKRIWQSAGIAILIALVGTNGNMCAQIAQPIPATQNYVQPAFNPTQYPVVPAQYTQPVQYQAQPVQYSQPVQYQAQPVRQQAGFDPFAPQAPPAAIPFPGRTYRVAQAPIQPPPQNVPPVSMQSPQFLAPQQVPSGSPQFLAPQQNPQVLPPAYVPPAYVPQNYTAPVPPSNPAFSPNYCNACPQQLWDAQLSYLFMVRTKSSSFPLLINGGGSTLVNAEQLDFGWQGGFDVALSRKYRGAMNFELRYFQIDGWAASHSAPYVAGDAIATNLPTPLFGAGTAGYVSDSSIHSFEMNIVNRALPTDKFRASLGFRWMELSENLAQSFSPSPTTFVIDTNNHLYGLQFGVDGVLFTSASGGFNVVGWSKSGIYANVADQSSVISGGPSIYNGARATTAAYVGESGLVGDYQLTQRLSFIGGYQLIWVVGVALAADQLPNMSSAVTGLVPTGLDQSDLLYHGAFLGFDYRW